MSIAASVVIARARARTDKTNSTFLSNAVDLIPWLDESHRELYELLVTSYGDEYFLTTATLAVAADAEKTSVVPVTVVVGESTTYYYIWKLVRVDVEFDDIRVPMSQFSFSDAVLDDTSHAWDAGVDIRYRFSDQHLYWNPRPSTAQSVKLYFVEVCDNITLSTDVIEPVCEPWAEYLVACLCLKIAQKEKDSDAIQAFMAEKADLRQRVISSAPARDIGQPQTIVDVRRNMEQDTYRDRWR